MVDSNLFLRNARVGSRVAFMNAPARHFLHSRTVHGFSSLCFLCACLTLLGCASHRRSATERVSRSSDIAEIILWAMPLALNLDKSPGADGFAIKVYAVSSNDPKTQPIRSGQLDILMFDGALVGSVTETNQPRRVWSYSDRELTAFVFQTTIGTAYALTLHWGPDVPKQDRITVAARYRPPQGPSISSAPSFITVVSQ